MYACWTSTRCAFKVFRSRMACLVTSATSPPSNPSCQHPLPARQDGNRIYIVLEICTGGDLGNYIRRYGRVSESTARYFLQQLAEGLKELRRHNVIHVSPTTAAVSKPSAVACGITCCTSTAKQRCFTCVVVCAEWSAVPPPALLLPGWMGGWMDGWMDGVPVGPTIASFVGC